MTKQRLYLLCLRVAEFKCIFQALFKKKLFQNFWMQQSKLNHNMVGQQMGMVRVIVLHFLNENEKNTVKVK